MSSTQQTVFRLTGFDGFENLQSFREPIPTPSAGEVLVKVRSVALNYRDVAIAKSKYIGVVKDNVIPFSDMAGEVVAIGPTTEFFKTPALAVGDAVIAPICPSSFLYGAVDKRPDALDYAWSSAVEEGVLREYIAIPAHVLIKLPPCKTPRDFVQWAATPGTGGVSIAALILAKAAGAITIVTSSSDEKLDFVRTRLGADYGINYKTTPDWAAEVQRITNEKGA